MGRKSQKVPGAHKLAQQFLAPESQAEKIRTGGFLIFGSESGRSRVIFRSAGSGSKGQRRRDDNKNKICGFEGSGALEAERQKVQNVVFLRNFVVIVQAAKGGQGRRGSRGPLRSLDSVDQWRFNLSIDIVRPQCRCLHACRR